MRHHNNHRGHGKEDYDATRVYNNTLYVADQRVSVVISSGNCPGKKSSYTLEKFQAMGEEPGTVRIVGLPATSEVLALAEGLLA